MDSDVIRKHGVHFEIHFKEGVDTTPCVGKEYHVPKHHKIKMKRQI